MSISKEIESVPTSGATQIGFHFRAARGKLLAALRALIAGMAASKDYRHLNGMTDQQLRRLGLTRSDIPDELHRRYFEPLAGCSDAAD